MVEGVFRKKWDYFIRYNDGEKSYFKKANPIALFFMEDRNGEYTDFVSHNIKYKAYEVSSRELQKFKKRAEELGKKYTMMKIEDYIIHEDWKKQDIQIPRIWYLDIEVIDVNNRKFPDVFNPDIPITHIQILDNKENKIWILMTKDITEEEKQELIEKYKTKTNKEIKFVYIDNEIKMLKFFTKMIKKFNPTIITGWNAEKFDFPYITKRMEYLGLDYKELSPLGEVEFKEIEEYGKPALITKWQGLYLFDLMEVFKKFAFMGDFKSYSLEYVSRVVLGDERGGKVDYGEFKSIHEFFDGNYKGFVDYAIQDVVLLDDMDNTIGLMNIIISSSVMMGCNFDDIMGTVRPWVKYTWHLGIEEGYALPEERIYTDTRPIKGGFVKEPKPSVYRWLFSVDFSSFYPSNQISFNLSPDVYVDERDLPQEALEILEITRDENEDIFLEKPELFDKVEKVCKKYDLAFGGLGFFSRKKEGLLPKVLYSNYNQRKAQKQKMLLAKALIS